MGCHIFISLIVPPCAELLATIAGIGRRFEISARGSLLRCSSIFASLSLTRGPAWMVYNPWRAARGFHGQPMIRTSRRACCHNMYPREGERESEKTRLAACKLVHVPRFCLWSKDLALQESEKKECEEGNGRERRDDGLSGYLPHHLGQISVSLFWRKTERIISLSSGF